MFGTLQDTLIRRARIWDYRTCSWSNIKPFQTWEDGEVSAPVELESCNAQELYDILARHSRKRRPVEVLMACCSTLQCALLQYTYMSKGV